MIDRAAVHRATAALAESLKRAGLPEVTTLILRAVVTRTLAPGYLRMDSLALEEHDAQTRSLPGLLPLRGKIQRGPLEAELAPVLAFEASEAAAGFGAVYESLLDGSVRRRAGAHHTEPFLARDVIARTLDPLVERLGSGETLTCCDPAMGSGVFLAEVRSRFGDRVQLYGVDRDPIAVALAKLALFAASDGSDVDAHAIDRQLTAADFTLAADAQRSRIDGTPLDLARVFPEVAARGGFDAIVGNPPWVAFAGRAAQRIAPELASYYRESTRAFAKYTTLHGVFVERAAAALRPGGRLGLVVPTSMADLAGYAPARAGHDQFAEADLDLPDYGADAFEGVFQPAMAIVSTARAVPIEPVPGEWPLRSDFCEGETLAFVARLRALPVLPESAFGERGFQTSGRDRSLLARAPAGRRVEALRCGADVTPFRREAASYYVDPAELGGRIATRERYLAVDLLIRQTARFPIACFADGERFRNSVLAGFASAELPRGFLLAWLNASAIRFYHYARFRDARQGMPQVKIQHLRSVPLVANARLIGDLATWGERIGLRNEGIRDVEQAELDAIVSGALDLSHGERALIEQWRDGLGTLPKSRPRARAPQVKSARRTATGAP